ncbi:MAG: ABC transporter ATP-binding protein [Alphaproteobacteria bacterium]|nr:ABC transporter ATP-binding protein [Alphaproteobacteria bacterium]
MNAPLCLPPPVGEAGSLAVSGLSVTLGTRRVLSGISLTAGPGEMIGLIGPNGAGKSTLLRAVCRLVEPEAGEIRVGGLPLRALSRRALARAVAYLEQGQSLHWPLSVEEVVALGRLPHGGRVGALDPEGAADVEAAMARAGCTEYRARPLDTLSGGEKARVMLARVLATAAPVMLVDEPVASLDPYHQLRMMELLRDEARSGRLVVCVLHDLALAARFCDRLVLLAGGRLVASGPAGRVLAPARLEAAFGVETLQGARDGEAWVLPWRRADAGPPSPAETTATL